MLQLIFAFIGMFTFAFVLEGLHVFDAVFSVCGMHIKASLLQLPITSSVIM